MANFLFWNIAGKDAAENIAALCLENDVDVVILAECQLSDFELLSALNLNGGRIYIAPFNPSTKLTFITRYDLSSLEPIFDDGGISIRLVRPPIGIELLLIAVHLPSKLYKTNSEQNFFSVQVAESIRFAEEKVGHSNSVLLGDFNMNPFEDGMVAADGIHGVMDRSIALQFSRVVDGKRRAFFYNPMWSRLGDESIGPPGTYFKRTGQISHFWHTFDQVLLRPSMLPYYSESSLKIITKIADTNLILNGKIDTSVSDHLPIVIQLNTETGV